MGYHRYYAHRMYSIPRWLEYFFLFWATTALVGKASAWVAQHKQHHAYVDTEKDPHSMKHKGFFYSYLLQFRSPIQKRFLIFDLAVKWQHRWYWTILLSYIVVVSVFGVFLEAWLYPMIAVHLIGGLVYSYSHRQGKPHDDFWLGLVTCGEGFHKTHHTSLAVRWNKFDLGGWLIEKI
jgi:stearoyl-CoA desaturase (delta-9 desaturase)